MNLLDCMPRWATPRTESRPTWGSQATKFAIALHTPLMAWQQYVLDVALEYDPATGTPCYRNIVVTVPRQNGKTTLILVLFLIRALGFDRQNMIYTAQNRNDAKKKMVNDWLPALNETKFNSYYDVTQANGNEAMKFNNGSLLALMATTEKSGHGTTIDLGVVDEAFSLPDARMDQALIPAMLTKRDAQYWITSTVGTYEKSSWLLGKNMNGRKAVEEGMREGVAYFEWSADESADPSLEATWRSCMPAMDVTFNAEVIRTIFTSGDMELSEFRRAFLNQWVDAPTDPVISLERWNQLVTEDKMTNESWALAFDVAEDRSASSIAAAWRRADGKFQVVLIQTGPGTAWVAPRIAGIWHDRRPVGIWCQRDGPAGSLISALNNLNVPLLNDSPVSDLAKGCGQFYDACIEGSLVHLEDPLLTKTLDGAVKRSLSDSWVWSRKNSSIDISPIVAITMALFGAMAFSRSPQVWSIQELMEEKRAKLAAIADELTSDQEHDSPRTEPDPWLTVPEPQKINPLSDTKRIPI